MARKDTVWEVRLGTYIETTSPSWYDVLINWSDHYLNFGTVSWTLWYGFRDNGWNIEYKNSGWSWAAFGWGGWSGTVTSVASADGSVTITNPTTTVNLAVVKAPILSTARTIWGQSFNGSANVTGNLALWSSNVTLTGSVGATGARATKVWTVALESTTMPTVNGTSLSSTFQPLDSDLTTIAGLTATTNNFIVSVASAWASRTPAQVRTTLGLVIGTNVQAWDADLDTWATKTAPSGVVLGTTDAQVVSDKEIQPRVVSATSYTTNTGSAIDVRTCDIFVVTAQAGALLFNNPAGSPTTWEKLIIRIKDDWTARALTYDTRYRASSDLALPSTTVLGKTLYMWFIYNSTDSKRDLLAVLDNF